MHPEGSAAFSKALGRRTVFDMKIASDFSILESQKEFVRRYCQHREEEPRLPMLTAACPGWDQYAEHVLGHPITPHLCMAKCPQQIMGSLVRITSPDGEIVQIMEQSDLASDDTAVDTLFGDMKEKEVRLHEGASSNGYQAHIFRHLAQELFNEDVGVLTYRTLRNRLPGGHP